MLHRFSSCPYLLILLHCVTALVIVRVRYWGWLLNDRCSHTNVVSFRPGFEFIRPRWIAAARIEPRNICCVWFRFLWLYQAASTQWFQAQSLYSWSWHSVDQSAVLKSGLDMFEPMMHTILDSSVSYRGLLLMEAVICIDFWCMPYIIAFW